jgi:hypothetical protein
LIQQSLDFAACEDDGHARVTLRALDAVGVSQLHLQHVTIEEEQRGEGLILRRGGDDDGEMREELSDLICAHLARVAFTVEEDEAFDPVGVSALGTEAQMAQSRDGVNEVEEFRLDHGVVRLKIAIESSARKEHHPPDGATWGKRFGLCRSITELCRIIRHNKRSASSLR